MTIKDLKHPGLFAAGVLFGTAGIKALSSKDAKKLYTNCTAAVLRAKKVVMDTVTTIQENAEDIYADAKQINEEREAAEEAVEGPFYNESLRSLLYKPWFSAELIYEFKPSDFYPVPNARICFAHFQRKTSADVEDAIDYRNFLSYIFLASGNTFKDKTKKLFTYEQQKRICKFLKIKLESTLTEISYDGWLYLYDVFLKFVSNEKKAIILNAEQDMKNNQNKIQKKHRNRNHGYWKFEAKRQKKLKFENGK